MQKVYFAFLKGFKGEVQTVVRHKVAVIQKIQWLSEFKFNFFEGKVHFPSKMINLGN